MSPAILDILLLLLGLLVGFGLGWFAAGRPVAEWRERHASRDAEARRLDEEFRKAITELATMSERARRADELAQELEQLREEHEQEAVELRDANAALLAQNAALKADAQNFADRERLLVEARDALVKQFEAAGAKVLEGAQESFLRRAADRFAQSEEKNEARIKALLAPVGDRLKSYEEQVAALEAKRADSFSHLNGVIEQMRAGQDAIRLEAQRLGNSLRNAPKARGRWGEQQLKNVLEQCGLSEHTDFETEHSIDTEDGRLRPDAIVRIPGNKLLVIDAKVSLNAYQDAFEAEDDVRRAQMLDGHATAMRAHVNTLGAKSYQSQFENAADYVIMFVPGEHFIAAALEQDPTLWDFAFERRVLLASPTNLVAIARTIAQVWRQEGLAKEAREIGKIASDLYDSIAKTQDDLIKTGIHLGRAINSFNDFSRTYEGNVTSRARRLSEKHIKIGKREIVEDVPLIDVVPRFANNADPDSPAELAAPDAVGGDEPAEAAST